MLLFVFFFFKQKTAYEVRISDWSSDVCSSDLEACGGDGAQRRRGIGGECVLDHPELNAELRMVRCDGTCCPRKHRSEQSGRQQRPSRAVMVHWFALPAHACPTAAAALSSPA